MSTLTAPTTQTAEAYTIDPIHSTIEFAVRHLMVSKVRGRFNAFAGTIAADAGTHLPQAVEVEIDVSSIDTREAQRDAHLKSADFLEVEKFPTISFASRRVEGTPEDFQLHGDLTIHGVTREVVLNGELEGHGADPWGGRRVGYSAKATISRKDFGLTWNQLLETGGVAVGDEVRIELNVEAVLQK